jgi:rhodanese-related sulfurtransferase
LEYSVDTSTLSVPSVSPEQLAVRLGRADAPLLLDVRREAKFIESPRMLAGARRCAPEDIAALTVTEPAREVVVYCVYGHNVSADAVRQLRAAGWEAYLLAGGIEGGEVGVDTLADRTRWRVHAPLTMCKRPDWGVVGGQPSRWITRDRPKIDRVGCPWLIRRFIDPRAEFFYVPAPQVFTEAQRLGAVVYDIPGAPVSHEGERCSFDALIQGFALRDAALNRLASIVRGADTGRSDLAPESVGLLALSLGLSKLHADDQAMLDAAMPLYDALYAWCQSAAMAVWQGKPPETHDWPPQTAGAA